MSDQHLYNLQLRLIHDSATPEQDGPKLEVTARPALAGPAYRGLFAAWTPIIDEICGFMQSSPFHRKAIQRTLDAGLAAEMINRETGKGFGFCIEFLESLRLQPITSA